MKSTASITSYPIHPMLIPSDGVLMCGTVQCPWHGSQFDVHTGEVKAGPAEVKIETYDVHDQKKKIGA